ncbi:MULTISPECIES: SMP-30/gluconolactonase/LRE family protein [unclassified Microbacterium]|uniref:SMP-30/gluconolactonase/LRE family protein n=1 Tax=unclassified Microbacterium TaxID=2609290 RepID=UPI00374549DA
MASEPTVFRELRSVLVESIFWDARTDELAWVDITAGTFHRGRLDAPVDGSADRVVSLPAPLSAVQPAAGGGFVAALKDRVVALDQDGRITATLGTVRHAHDGIRFNEGKVDPFGRFIVGSMDVTESEPDAAVYAFVDGAEPELWLGGFGTTNGFEWSDTGDEMYLTDTATKTVYRSDYGPGAFPFGELRPHLRGYTSDGLARDSRGWFWNAVYGDGRVLRWNPDGSVAGSVAVAAPNVTSVGFGGPDLGALFIGSARENLTEEQLEAAPLSGSIFRLDIDVPGRPVGTFAAG